MFWPDSSLVYILTLIFNLSCDSQRSDNVFVNGLPHFLSMVVKWYPKYIPIGGMFTQMRKKENQSFISLKEKALNFCSISIISISIS